MTDEGIVVHVQKEDKARVIRSNARGPAGPKGDKGDKGDTGDAGPSGTFYLHVQGSPASTWNVSHNLGYYPNVTVEDSTGEICEGVEIEYDSENDLRILVGSPFSGRAYLS